MKLTGLFHDRKLSSIHNHSGQCFLQERKKRRVGFGPGMLVDHPRVTTNDATKPRIFLDFFYHSTTNRWPIPPLHRRGGRPYCCIDDCQHRSNSTTMVRYSTTACHMPAPDQGPSGRAIPAPSLKPFIPPPPATPTARNSSGKKTNLVPAAGKKVLPGTAVEKQGSTAVLQRWWS